MSVRARQIVECSIAKAAIEGLLEAGYTVSVDNGEEVVIRDSVDVSAILAELFSVDEEHLRVKRDGKSAGYVFLVYGNDGWDVISDYTTNLEAALTKANALADRIESGEAFTLA